MKRILLSIQFTLLFFAVSAQGEWVSASIGNGAASNKVDLFIRSTNTFDANKCDNLVFTIRIPIAAGNSIVATETFHSPAFSHITFAITKLNVNDGTYNYYLINGIGTAQVPAGTNIVGGDPAVRVLEITFSGGTNAVVELANIENDIPGNSFIRPQFYTQINIGDITNYGSMFFGTGGATPQNNANPDGDDWVPTLGNVILPVQFAKYDIQCNDKGAIITWATATEQNSNRFEIQRSTDGINWTTIDNVVAAGNSNDQKNYQYLDLNGGTAFYRIRQVDNDGRFVNTAVKRTDCKKTQYDVALYPVPAKDNLSVVIRSDNASRTELQIMDMLGKTLQRVPAQINRGNNNFNLNVSELPAGQYMLVGSDPSIQINKKFTIIR